MLTAYRNSDALADYFRRLIAHVECGELGTMAMLKLCNEALEAYHTGHPRFYELVGMPMPANVHQFDAVAPATLSS